MYQQPARPSRARAAVHILTAPSRARAAIYVSTARPYDIHDAFSAGLEGGEPQRAQVRGDPALEQPNTIIVLLCLNKNTKVVLLVLLSIGILLKILIIVIIVINNTNNTL